MQYTYSSDQRLIRTTSSYHERRKLFHLLDENMLADHLSTNNSISLPIRKVIPFKATINGPQIHLHPPPTIYLSTSVTSSR